MMMPSLIQQANVKNDHLVYAYSFRYRDNDLKEPDEEYYRSITYNPEKLHISKKQKKYVTARRSTSGLRLSIGPVHKTMSKDTTTPTARLSTHQSGNQLEFSARLERSPSKLFAVQPKVQVQHTITRREVQIDGTGFTRNSISAHNSPLKVSFRAVRQADSDKQKVHDTYKARTTVLCERNRGHVCRRRL